MYLLGVWNWFETTIWAFNFDQGWWGHNDTDISLQGSARQLSLISSFQTPAVFVKVFSSFLNFYQSFLTVFFVGHLHLQIPRIPGGQRAQSSGFGSSPGVRGNLGKNMEKSMEISGKTEEKWTGGKDWDAWDTWTYLTEYYGIFMEFWWNMNGLNIMKVIN